MRQRPSPTLGAWQAALPCWSGSQGRQTAGSGLRENCRDMLAGKLAEPFISRGKENGAQTKKFQPFQATAQNSLQTGCRSRCKFKREIARPALPGQRFPVSVMMAPMKEQQNRGSHENRQSPPAELTRPRASLLAIAHIGKARLAMGV